MKKYIRNLNAFLKPHEAIKNGSVIKYWVDDVTWKEFYKIYDYKKQSSPLQFGINVVL